MSDGECDSFFRSPESPEMIQETGLMDMGPGDGKYSACTLKEG